MGIKLNLTGEEIGNAQGGNFKPLPEGTYGAVVYDSKFKKSKAQNDMYELEFKITDGPEGIGRKIRGYFTLTAKALFKVIELNKATDMPYPTKKWAEEHPGEDFEFADADEYLSKQVNLVVIQEPYESVDEDDNPVTLYRNNIKYVRAYDEDKHTTADDVEAKGDAKTGGLFL